MPIPFAAAQSPIPPSLSNTTSSNIIASLSSSPGSGSSINNSSTSLSSHRLNLSGSSGRLHSHSLDSNSSRRWTSRLHRRSPLDSNLVAYQHSPRTRYFSSFAPTDQPSTRMERQYHHQSQQSAPQQVLRHFDESPPSSSSIFSPLYQGPSSVPHDRSFVVSGHLPGQTLSPISIAGPLPPPSAHQTTTSSTTIATTTASASTTSTVTSTTEIPAVFFSSSPPRFDTEHSHQQQLHSQSLQTQRTFSPSISMESSGPSESISRFLASEGTATMNSHQSHVNPFNHRSQLPQTRASSTVHHSTPMQRSLTTHADISSSIAAARSDPSSASISISSSPSSAVLLPALTPSTSLLYREHTIGTLPPLSGRDTASVISNQDNVANVIPDRDRGSHHSPHTIGHYSEGEGETTYRRNQTHPIRDLVPSEADERIHFRLLNNFTTSARQSGYDYGLGMSSAIRSQGAGQQQHWDTQSQQFAGHEDERMLEDEMDGMEYERSIPHNTMFSNQDEGVPYVMLRRRSNYAELIEEEDNEEDDEDDGIDQVMDSRRHGGSRTYSVNLDSIYSPSLSHIEHPQHAQLSPRSATSLTRMFSAEHSSQSLMDSSISSDLNALSQQMTPHEYDNNPYFRRPFTLHTSRGGADFQLNTRTPLVHHNYAQENIFRADGTGSPTTSTTRSVSLRYDTIRHNHSNHRGCGESTTVTSMETQGDVRPLKFDMYYADGGEFNAAHSVENALKNDSSVYCSRRSTNINICLKLAEPYQTCILTQFNAKAPTTGFTAPCKEGLIFISHEPILLERTAFFDNMTQERYEEYMESLKDGEVFEQLLQSHGAGADALVPAAFFQVGGPDESCTLDFTPNRSGRYVLIKLLRSRCTNSLQRPENIDLQYLGLIGFTNARSFASGGFL